ncbi:hypothetical protein EJB05_11971, partial [Eragrostis curvula]
MASPIRTTLRRTESAEFPRQPATLSDDLLEEIFLRTGSPVDLARASTTSANFRRLIADPSFLRRYRSLHPPLLLGFIWAGYGSFAGANFNLAEAPLPSASPVRALERAADFSFNDYLPRRRNGWDPCDVRVLLEHIQDVDVYFPDLAVCDALSRKYLLMPPIPDNQLHSVHGQDENSLPIEFSAYWEVRLQQSLNNSLPIYLSPSFFSSPLLETFHRATPVQHIQTMATSSASIRQRSVIGWSSRRRLRVRVAARAALAASRHNDVERRDGSSANLLRRGRPWRVTKKTRVHDAAPEGWTDEAVVYAHR